MAVITFRGAAPDPTGLLVAGESPLRRESIQASSPCSVAFEVPDFSVGNSMCGPDLLNMRRRAREKVGAQERRASNLAICTRHKELITVPITCAASRFPCISAWQERCVRIGARAWLQWAAPLVCEHKSRQLRGFLGH